MRLIDYKAEIKESEEVLRAAYAKLNSDKLSTRSTLLIWLKTGQVKTMGKAVALQDRSLSYGCNMWKLYKTAGLERYLQVN